MLGRWFPGRDVVAERTASGTSTPVHRVTVDGEEFYLRPGEDPGDRRDAEVAVHRILRSAGAPVPAVVRYEAAPPELDRSVTLTTAIPGHPVDPGTAPDAVFRAAGRALAQVNALPVRGFGWVERVEGDRLVAAYPTRAGWVAEYGAAAATVIASGLIPSHLERALDAAIVAWAARPDEGRAALAHGDFDESHIFVTGQGEDQAFSGIIDFGEIRGADPLYDLGHAFLLTGNAVRARVMRGLLAGYARAARGARGAVVPPDAGNEIRLQALAIGTRWLAIMLDRPPGDFRAQLATSLAELLEHD